MRKYVDVSEVRVGDIIWISGEFLVTEIVTDDEIDYITFFGKFNIQSEKETTHTRQKGSKIIKVFPDQPTEPMAYVTPPESTQGRGEHGPGR